MTQELTDTASRDRAAEPGPVLAAVGAPVRTITLNRPESRNGLNRTLSEALLAAVVDASADSAVRCIVITGSGPAFCAGDDLATVSSFLAGDRSEAPAVEVTGDAHYLRICEAMLCAPKPVIVGLNGVAAGAGTEIACAADYRLAAASARIGSGLVRVGHVGNAVMLGRVVGPARATEIFLTGRFVGADEAERIGLVDRVVDDDVFDHALGELAAGFAAGPTKAVGMFKELREQTWMQPSIYGLRLQDIYHVRSHTELEDGIEGPRAFIEHRPPRFSGR